MLGGGVNVFYVFIKRGLCFSVMPWFFFAAGFFLMNRYGEPGWYKNSLARRVRTLFVPWQIVTIVSICSAYCFSLLGMSNYVWPFSNIFDFIDSAVGVTHQLPLCVHFWFVRNLLVLVMLSPLFVIAVKKSPIVFVSILYIVGWVSSFLEKALGLPPLFFYSWVSLDGLPFFVMGIMVRYYDFDIVLSKGGHLVALFVFLMLCICVNVFGLEGFKYPLKFAGMLALWGIVSSESTWKCLQGVSFPVYAFHILGITVFSGMYKYLGIAHAMETSVFGILFTAIAVFWIIVGIMSLLRRMCPRIMCVILGGR